MMTPTKNRLTGLVGGFALLLLTGCNLAERVQNLTPDATGIYFTAVAIMTERVGTVDAPPTQSVATPRPEVVSPTVGDAAAGTDAGPGVQSSPSLPCNLARPGLPLDVTIPDDTRLQPGEPFTKTWRLINAGSCTWTREYSVIWFSGDELGVTEEVRLSQSVPPGESVDIAVDMVAPGAPGVYASYWMLRSDRDTYFGLGPNGDAPFWARIQVVVVSTATPTPTLLPSPTPAVEVSGTATLSPGQTFDLDSGLISADDESDLALEGDDSGQMQLRPLGTARLGVFGSTSPAFFDCSGLTLSDTGIALEGQQAGTYMCYRTNHGLYGRLLLIKLLSQGAPLELEYLTWSAP